MQLTELRTSICLYAGGDLTWANLVKKGDVLAKDGLEVLTNSPSGHLGSVDPSTHVNVSADNHFHTFDWWGEVMTRRSVVRHHQNEDCLEWHL